MNLEKFKERDNKKVGVIVFTIVCVLLISGVILYRTFAIFEIKIDQNIINGQVQDKGDLEFAFYQDDGDQLGDHIVKTAPEKGQGYSLDTSTSYCKDLISNKQVSNVSWNDERWSIELKDITTTKTKCYLHFKKIYKEDTLNGAIPDLMNGRLVPVTISETKGPDFYTGDKGGNVYKADITKEWYKYAEKKWANAVILKTGVEDNYRPGEQIPEENIESYFVWIPRYSYKLQDEESTFNSYTFVTDLGNQVDVNSAYKKMTETNQEGNMATNHGFEIEFGSKDKGISATLLSKGDSIVHPAFEAFDSNGFWVGKFETGYNQNSDGNVVPADSWNTQGAQKNEQASTKVIIKPSVYSWRNINVSNAFYTSYEYKRELESHMMKNMEWGAVAYLTQSKYGRCEENGNCSEVRINNSENYITGSSAKEAPTCGATSTKESCNYYETLGSLYMDGSHSNNYYNKASQVSSTTGNYSGIYDMSGSAWEYVMGVMQAKDKDATPATGPDASNNSGFNGPYSNNGDSPKTDGKSWPSSKYYDLYDYNSLDQTYYKGKLGDGTKEFGPFYSVKYIDTSKPTRIVGSYNADDAYFLYMITPWFARGGHLTDGTDAGLFAFSGHSGDIYNSVGFRIVLTP